MFYLSLLIWIIQINVIQPSSFLSHYRAENLLPHDAHMERLLTVSARQKGVTAPSINCSAVEKWFIGISSNMH